MNPSRSLEAEPSGLLDTRELDGWAILAILRRRMVVVVSIAGLALAAGALWVVTRPAEYTTSVLVQKQELPSPLSRGDGDGRRVESTSDAMASEVELLRSEAILEPVVYELALALSVPDRPDIQPSLSVAATIDSLVPGGTYVLSREASRMRLLDAETDTLVAEDDGTGVLDAPGFRLAVDSFPVLDDRLPLTAKPVSDAVAGLRRRLRVEQLEATNLIRIRFTARDPRVAAAVVNAVAESYQRRATAVARDAATRRREFLGEQLALIADSVEEVQQRLAQFQEETQVIDAGAEGEGLSQSLRQARLDLRRLQYEEGVLESLVNTLELEEGGGGLERIMTLSEEMVPGGETVYTRLRDLESERRRLTIDRYGYREESSRVAVVDSLISRTRQELLSLVREALNLTRTARIEARQEVSSLQSRLGNLPAQASRIDQLEQNADAVASTFQLLSERYYEAQTAEAVAAADVAVVDRASPPLLPDRERRLFPMLLALMFGVGTGSIAAFLLEGMDRTVRRIGDAESATGLPLLATIPRFPVDEDAGEPAATGEIARSSESLAAREAFRGLAVVLQTIDASRAFVIASQGPTEGKSLVSWKLAEALADTGRTTLLIDADLYRPDVGSHFGVADRPGVREFVVEQRSVSDLALVTSTSRLSVIPAGKVRGSDSLDVVGAAWSKLLAEARRHYEMVIVDTPPVLGVATTLELARHADGVLLVARAEETRRDALAEACRRLRQVDAPLVGLVVNGVRRIQDAAPGGGYYYRHHHYRYPQRTQKTGD